MADTIPYQFAPGAVAANTATTMPSDAPHFQYVTSVLVQTDADAGTASTTEPAQATVKQSVPTGGLAAGDIALTQVDSDGNQEWQYGSATTAGTVFTVIGFVAGRLQQVS